ncbi:MAG: tetratricopeptide repeat protein [Planctomycetota bacterium]|jgi:tetratricopeptide (TPR) repeat protein
MTKRGRYAALAALVLLAAGRPAGAAPKDLEAELRRVSQQIQRRQYSQALKALDALAASHKAPDEQLRIGLTRVDCHLSARKYPEAVAESARLAALAAKDKDLKSRLLVQTGDALRGAKKHEQAIAAYRRVAKEYADYADRAAEALLRAGEVYSNELKKPAEALAVYAEVPKAFSADVRRSAEAVRRSAYVHETMTRDYVKAAGLYQSLSETYADAYDERNRSIHYAKAVACLRAGKKLPEALAVAAKAEKALPSAQYKTPFAVIRVDLLLEMSKHAEVRTERDRVVCAYPLDPGACRQAQLRVVQSYRARSKFAEALGAARVLYNAAGDERSIRDGAHAVAMAFRSTDGHLGRANEFLTYQRYGPNGPDGRPNTPDDVKANHLLAARYPPSTPARDKLYTAAIAAQPKTYPGYRAQGYLYMYWGKPREGARMFREAMKACTDAEVPQAAVELIMVGMKAHTASFHGLERMFEFVSYGTKGKTGKENLPDPFKGL